MTELRARKRDRFREGDFRHRGARTGWSDGGFSGLRKHSSQSHPRSDACAGADRGAIAHAARELACEWRKSSISSGCSRSRCSSSPMANLIINELAPRPHNSGHWTIEGCVTSQFEQHVRAVCGMPLGATDLLRRRDGEFARRRLERGRAELGGGSGGARRASPSLRQTAAATRARWATSPRSGDGRGRFRRGLARSRTSRGQDGDGNRRDRVA